MKDLIPVNRVNFRDISIREGINAIRAIDSGRATVSAELENKLERILTSEWVDKEIKADAQESLMGVLNSIENKLAKQTELHTRNLISAYNYNNSLRTTEILKAYNVPAKLFSVIEKPANVIDVKGQGFTWKVFSIEESEEIVPSMFLERLTMLKYNGIIPDTLFIAVPFAKQKLTLGNAVKNDIGKTLDIIQDVLAAGVLSLTAIHDAVPALTQMEDPLLICGFGKSPVFLVEIGKWV